MSGRTPDEIMADPAGDIIAPRIQYLEEWIRDCQRYNRNVSANLTTSQDRIRDLESLLEAKNTTLRAVHTALDQYDDRVRDALIAAHDHGCENDLVPWNKLSMYDINRIAEACALVCGTCNGTGTVRGMNHESPADPLYPCPTCVSAVAKVVRP